MTDGGTATSVRPLMTGLPDIPPFRMLLAPGWERFVVDDQSASELARRASERIRHLGRPDLDAQLANETHRSFAAMRTAGSRLVYLPTAVGYGALLPVSIVASVLRGEHGASLDPHVSALLRDGAGFLDEDRTTVRFEQTDVRGSGMTEGALSHRVNYVIAVPGTGRRTGVLFTTTIMGAVQQPLDDETREGAVALSDAMISTFAWIRADALRQEGEAGTSAH